MKAAFIEAFGDGSQIRIGDIPDPVPREDEVCIEVAYAGVNPADAKVARGLFQTRMPCQFPLILGWEASGVIQSLGSKSSSWKVGDRVYAYCKKPIIQWGTWAEYVTVSAENVAPIPKTLSFSQAAAVPLAGLTAWQALFEKMGLQKGKTVLIHGGGGGVGSYAIQWAKNQGSHVITTASSSKFAYVKSLGADEVIDYKTTSFVEYLKSAYPSGIYGVFDTQGKTIYQQSFEVLQSGGCIVSLLEQPNKELAEQYQVRAEYLFVHPSGKDLRAIAKLFESGKAIVPDIRELPFASAANALKEIQSGHTQGKIVLRIKRQSLN